MNKGLIASLLALACLGGSTAALAVNTQARAASSLYAWEVSGDEDRTIFRAEGGRCSSWVIVYVDADEHECHSNDRSDHFKGVTLRGCGHEDEVHVRPGEGRKCLVRAGKDLKVKADGEDYDKRAKGTWQEIHI